VVALKNGRSVAGLKTAESDTTLTLVDSQGQKQVVEKADIEEQTTSPLSTTPEGLERRLAEGEFADLIAVLASLKEEPKR
jgi:putative heme-binding domain-containing protein